MIRHYKHDHRCIGSGAVSSSRDTPIARLQHQDAATEPVTTLPGEVDPTDRLAGMILNDPGAGSSHRGDHRWAAPVRYCQCLPAGILSSKPSEAGAEDGFPGHFPCRPQPSSNNRDRSDVSALEDIAAMLDGSQEQISALQPLPDEALDKEASRPRFRARVKSVLEHERSALDYLAVERRNVTAHPRV